MLGIFPKNLLPDKIPIGQFFRFRVSPRKSYCVLFNKPPIFDVLHLVETDYKVNLLAVYEIKVGDPKGATIGYLIDTPSKFTKMLPNLFMAQTGTFATEYSDKSIMNRDVKVKMKYRVDNLGMFSYGVGCSFIVVEPDSRFREQVEM